jgi:hypothetical protein
MMGRMEALRIVRGDAIGCGFAGGRWERIEPPVTAALGERGVATTLYDSE